MEINTIGVYDGQSWNQNNNVQGTDGDDTIITGADTQQFVTEINPKGKEIVHEVNDNDTIEGGDGNDVMTGGFGNDKFVFNFHFETKTTTLLYDDVVATPTQTSGANTNGVWNSYLSNLNEWRAALESQYGADQDTATEIQAYTYSSGKTVKTGVAVFDDSFTFVETVVTGDGHDVITDFGNGSDSLELNGLTGMDSATFSSHFNVTSADGTTVLSWTGGSITIHGLGLSDAGGDGSLNDDFFALASASGWLA